MIKKSRSKLLIILALIGAVTFLLPGCDEEEIYTISQEDELERFIVDSEQGRELFRIHDFVTGAPYSYANNDTVYTDFLDSSARSIQVVISDDSLIDIGVGTYYFSRVTVYDDIWGRTSKQAGGETVEKDFWAEVTREAYLIKLGDNSQPYTGWVLYGYNGGFALPAVSVISPDADTFVVNFNRNLVINNTTISGYFDVNDMFVVDKGDQLIVDGCVNFTSVINYEATGSYTTEGLTHPNTTGTCVTDTITLPAATDRFWNTMLIRSYATEDLSRVYYDCVFVPYKINP